MMEEYEFELEKAKAAITTAGAKTVVIQLPDGLKPHATKIADLLKTKDTEIYIWAGSCFGACDIPNVKADLLIQFGHNKFRS